MERDVIDWPSQGADESLQGRWLTTVAGLERLGAEWEVLWSECRTATPFQHPGWLLPWWKHFGEGRLLTAQFRAAQRLVGLAPLYLRANERGIPELLPLGTGTSDYVDFLFGPQADLVLAGDKLCRELDSVPEWQRCVFRQVRAKAVLHRLWSRTPWRRVTAIDEPCPAVALPGTLEELESRLKPHFVHDLHYFERRARRQGLSIESVGLESVEPALDALEGYINARCAARRQASSIRHDPGLRFLKEAAVNFLRAGFLRLYVMRTGDRIGGVLLGFHHRDRFYYYLGGYAPDLASVSPGKLLIHHALAQAMREGAASFDFLRGSEGYKFDWNAVEEPTVQWELVRDGMAHRPAPDFALAPSRG